MRDAAEAPLHVLSRTDRVQDALKYLDADHNAWPVMDAAGVWLAPSRWRRRSKRWPRDMAGARWASCCRRMFPPVADGRELPPSAYGSSAGHGAAPHGAKQVNLLPWWAAPTSAI